MKTIHSKNTSNYKGFTLLEVLVALLILSIGLLGLVNLQMRGLQYSDSARQRSQATFLAYDILDRMRANKGEVDNGTYDILISAAAPQPLVTDMCSTVTVSCTPDKLADYDLWEWKNDLSTYLPNGNGSVRKDNTILTADVYEITVQWDRRAFSESDKATALGTQLSDSIVIQTEL
ncbi:MAG: type IV pilus modification protein PilV [Gammaproteobacteria bacterium]|nr:type IV pilus modification protein PilV [Gammaproteobacteria bacterium]